MSSFKDDQDLFVQYDEGKLTATKVDRMTTLLIQTSNGGEIYRGAEDWRDLAVQLFNIANSDES